MIDPALIPQNPEPPPPDDAPASFWDVASAAWRRQTVVSDTLAYENGKRWDLAREMERRLGPEGRRAVGEGMTGRTFADPLAAYTGLVLDAASREVPADPAKWGNYPLDPMQFQARIDRDRRAEIDEADAILDRPGGGFAEFLGSSARMVVDPVNMMLAPLGVEGGLVRVMIGEAVLGGLAEGLNVPREQEVAGELGLPTPSLVGRVAEGAAMGAGITGVIGGAIRAGKYLLGRRAAERAAAPEGVDPVTHEGEIEATRNELSGQVPAGQALADRGREATGAALAMSDFDFTPAGNASPRTNRIGYVFGRFLEAGLEPEDAAAFVGNFMVESTPGLHPHVRGDGGAALGLAQWNDRRPALEAFAAKRGKPPEDLDTQIAFVLHELETTEASAWAKIRAARTVDEKAAAVSQFYERPGIPHLGRRVGNAREVMRQYQSGQVPRWTGPVAEARDVPQFATSRGYTGQGQVSTASGRAVDVRYEVVDAALLRRASGDLQPRDRGRANSDAWIAETAARLDPAQLMPSPNAATGAPLVGPDMIVESGNGRVAAIGMAYDRFPDRAAAYRQAIEDLTGQPIPDGVARPVLIARRTSELDEAARRELVIDAQDSGVARMTPTEIARVSARMMTPEVIGRLDLGAGLFDAANDEFARRALAGLPASERNALYAGGRLNQDGRRRLTQALFARAWAAPDLLTRFAETDSGELKALMDALADAAPAWAALRADIEAGRVLPEADIGPYILDALRLIAAARETAGRDGGTMAAAVADLLDQIDLLDGALSPLTVALIRRKFWKNHKPASAAEIAGFLKRYAAEARQVATTGNMFGAGAADILRRIDPEVFGDLPDDLGLPRAVAAPAAPEIAPAMAEEAWAAGAASPEAEAADTAAFDDLRASAADQASPAAIAAARADFGDLTLRLADGTEVRAADLLDDIEADQELATVLDLCGIGGAP